MSTRTLDDDYADLSNRASPAFRRVLAAVEQEIEAGSPGKAAAFAEGLFAKRMGPTDRRCVLALITSLRAVSSLRAAGVPADLRHHIGFAPAFDLDRQHLPAVMERLRPEVAERAAHRLRCPNCGGDGDPAGWVPLVQNRGVPHGRFYIDHEAAVREALPGANVDPVHAHLLATSALARLGARADVLACQGCGLRYVSWRRDGEVAEQYGAALGGGFELNGKSAFGRAHLLSFAYTKAAIPLHIESAVGVADKDIYELGCAEGMMADQLGTLGARVTGSDMDRPKVHYAREGLGLNLSDDGDYFWRVTEASQDIAYSFHTMEHVLAVDRFFDQFRKMLRPGAALVVSVPHNRVNPDGIVSHMGGDHLVGYDRDSLVGFFERHGFQIVDVKVDDGTVPAELLDPIRGMPAWAGISGDVTVIGVRT